MLREEGGTKKEEGDERKGRKKGRKNMVICRGEARLSTDKLWL